MERRNELVNIRVENLYPHPDNPRKDLGDITEITESVKKNGVMQNLTVIPIGAAHEEPEKQVDADKISTVSDFIVLIGHRRLAAAKAAGIKEVPCKIVSKISKKEQVSIMLEENMQRSDLTIYEQAQGFQMMLDLGETAETIAEKTGFSKATVYHRLNLAKLDRTELEKKEKDDSFQMSLKDLYELEKVEDLETRNKILSQATSSNDLAYKAKQAVLETKRQKYISSLIPMLEEKGIQAAPDTAKYERWAHNKWDDLKRYDTNSELPDEIKVQAKKTDKLFYVRWSDEIHVIRKVQPKKKTESKEEKERKERDARKKELRTLIAKMTKRTGEFISCIMDGTLKPIKTTDELHKRMLEASLTVGVGIYRAQIITYYAGESSYTCTEEKKAQAEEKIKQSTITQLLLIYMKAAIETVTETFDYYMKHDQSKAERMMKIYEILEMYGWTFEEEEQQIMNGTHELYVKEEK